MSQATRVLALALLVALWATPAGADTWSHQHAHETVTPTYSFVNADSTGDSADALGVRECGTLLLGFFASTDATATVYACQEKTDATSACDSLQAFTADDSGQVVHTSKWWIKVDRTGAPTTGTAVISVKCGRPVAASGAGMGPGVELNDLEDAATNAETREIPIGDVAGGTATWTVIDSSTSEGNIDASGILTIDDSEHLHNAATITEVNALASGTVLSIESAEFVIGQGTNDASYVLIDGTGASDASIAATGVVTVNADSHTHTSTIDAGTVTEANDLETDGAPGAEDTFVFVGDGADTGNFVDLSGPLSIDNTGATTIALDHLEHATKVYADVAGGADEWECSTTECDYRAHIDMLQSHDIRMGGGANLGLEYNKLGIDHVVGARPSDGPSGTIDTTETTNAIVDVGLGTLVADAYNTGFVLEWTSGVNDGERDNITDTLTNNPNPDVSGSQDNNVTSDIVTDAGLTLVDDEYNTGFRLKWTSGPNSGVSSDIIDTLDNNPSADTIQLADSFTMLSGETFDVLEDTLTLSNSWAQTTGDTFDILALGLDMNYFMIHTFSDNSVEQMQWGDRSIIQAGSNAFMWMINDEGGALGFPPAAVLFPLSNPMSVIGFGGETAALSTCLTRTEFTDELVSDEDCDGVVDDPPNRYVNDHQNECIMIENLVTADDAYILIATEDITVTHVGCHRNGGADTVAEFTFDDQDGTAISTGANVVCSTTTADGVMDAVTSGASVAAGQVIRVDNAVAPGTGGIDDYTFCVRYYVD